jgi:putative phosphoserine phosphatase/1-acylglycerol-3-phosphate O-acyltransferase
MGTISSNASNSPFSYIVFFDLDRTITRSISGKALVSGAYRKGLMTKGDLLNAILQSVLFSLKLRDPMKIIDKMVGWVKGIPENTMDSLCYEITHQVLLPSVFPQAITEIKMHKARNAKIVILSSALAPVCREIAKTLEIDDIICSELESKDGYMTGKSSGPLCFGDEKAVRLLGYCNMHKCFPSEAWYYGDSISDLPPLNTVGTPVCVNPDKKLLKTASKKGWKILKWEV